MKRLLRLAVGTVLITGTVMSSGCVLALFCAGAGLAVGASVYQDGILRTLEGHPMPRVWQATVKALTKLEYPMQTAIETSTECRVEARGPNDEKIKIWMTPFDEDVTDLRIQIGLIGNEELSRHILDTMRESY